MQNVACCKNDFTIQRANLYRFATLLLFFSSLVSHAQIPITTWDNFVANSDGNWYEFDAENTNLPDGYVPSSAIEAAFNAGDSHMGLSYNNTRFKYESTVPEMGIPGLLAYTPTGANNANYWERISVPKSKDKFYTPAREIAVRMDYFLIHPGNSKSGNVQTDLRTYYPEPHVKRNGVTTFGEQPGAGTNPVKDGDGCEFVLLSQYGPNTFKNNFPYGNKGDLYGLTLPQGKTTFDLTGQYESFDPNSTTYTKDRTVFAVGVYAHDVTDYNYQSQIFPCYPNTNIRLTIPAGELIQNRFLIGLNTTTNGVSNGDGYFHWWMKIPSINNGQWFLAATLTNRSWTGDVGMKLANLGIGQYNGGNGKSYYLDNGNTANGLWYHNYSVYYSNSNLAGGSAPQVSLTNPAGGTTFTAGDDVLLKANATDSDGSVTKVEFFYDGLNKIGTDQNSPYQYTWQNVQTGTYTLTAVATDDAGLKSVSAPVTITVLPPFGQQPPTVTLTNPPNGAKLPEGTDITLSATASDNDGNVVKVEFWQGGTLLYSDGAAPYEFTWTQPAVGTYQIKAVATDNSGLSTSTPVSTIQVIPPKAAPTVAITTPSNNAQFMQGDQVTIEADASDPDGTIAKVEFYAAGNFLKTEYQYPYQASWDNVPAGTHTIHAIAYDNDGQTTQSQSVTIIVNSSSGGAGIFPPLVQFIEPVDGATYMQGDDIAVEAKASDADGTIVRVEFFMNGNAYKTEKVTPYEAPLFDVQPGQYTLMAIAFDNEGLKDTAIVTYTVVSAGGGSNGMAPAVQITSPTDGSSFVVGDDIEVEAIASDSDGSIQRIEFFLNGNYYKTEKVFPYLAPLKNVQAGQYSLMAVAYDNDGLRDTAIVSYTVSNPTAGPPSVQIIKPLDGAQFEAGDDVEVEAVATDADGTIAKVDFYLDGNKWRTEKNAPYTGELDNMQQGIYELMAIAYDNDGYRDTSIITFTVDIKNPIPPVVKITSPADGATFQVGDDVEIVVDATDPDGDISKVEIYVDNDLIQIEKWYPYDKTWSNVQAGTYILRAIAYDDDGNSTTSDKVIVTVGGGTSDVKGLTFEAVVDEGLVICSWTAQEELNLLEYRLSRSSDSMVYQQVSTMSAVGTSTSPTSYDEIDPEPFPEASWYKLEAIDVSGNVLETRIAKVDLTEPKVVEKWIVYPNPLQGNKPIKVWALLTENVDITIELNNAYGQVMLQEKVSFTTGENKHVIGLNTLPPGIYFFTLRKTQTGEVLDTKMFIKTP